jgi:PAS domain S-box-containing protein
MKSMLKILHVEDSELDSELINSGLSAHGVLHEICLVDSPQKLGEVLKTKSFDLVLCDYSIPGFDGNEALRMVKAVFPDMPFIYVSGTIGEERAVEVLKNGATDYVLKDRLEKLYPAIERALDECERKEKIRSMNALIQQNEERLNYVLKATKDAVWDLDLKTNSVWRNEAANDLFGMNVASLGFDWWKAQLHDEDRESVLASIEKALSDGSKTWQSEYRILRQDGTYAAMSDRGFIIYDADNVPIRMIGAMRDISDQVKHINDLRASEEKFRALFNLLPVGVSIVGLNRELVDFNQELVKIQELDVEELKQGSYLKRQYIKTDGTPLSAEDFPSVRAMTTQSVITNVELGIVKDKNRVTWANISAAPIPGTGAVVVTTDITSRILAERELRESEEKYRSLVDTSPDAIFLTDLSGTIIFANKQTADLFEFNSAQEMYGRNFYEFFTAEDYKSTRARLLRIFDEDDIRNFEVRLCRKNGSFFVAEASISLILNDEKVPKAFIGVLRDITVRKQTELDLVKAKEKAEEMNRLKSSFLANMSHELRTPLIGILGFAEILSGELSDSSQKKMIEMIFKGGKRLSETLNLILDISRIEADKITTNHEVKELNPIVAGCVDLLSGAAAQKQLILNCHISEEPVYALIDNRMFVDVVNNLLNNAIKFTEKGSIQVTLKTVHEDGQNWILFSVRDTGIGIPDDALGYIFEEFRQVSEGLNRWFEGTGLGLTIVKKFVQLMNGRIVVESQIDVGSTFSVYLPVVQQQEAETSVQKDAPGEQSGITGKKNTNWRILYVEDDPPTQELVKLYLKPMYTVDIAPNAERGLQLLGGMEYHVLLVDINLGRGLSGIEFINAAKTIGNYVRVPKIAITAHAMVGDREKFLESGFDYYIDKPFGRKALLELLEKVLG